MNLARESLDLNDYFKSSLNSMSDLEDAMSTSSFSNALRKMITKIYTKLEEQRYVAESFPSLVLLENGKMQNIQERKDLYTSRLLTAILLQKIEQKCKKLTDAISFDQISVSDLKMALQELMQVTNHVEELTNLQERLINEGNTNKQFLKKLERKYAKRIEELESKLSGTEEKVLEIDELITKGKLPKKRFLRKKKFIKALSDLIAKDLPNFHAEFGAFTTIPTLYNKIQDQYDLDLDLEDIIDACEVLSAKGIIPGIKTLPSGTKIIELTPVELDPDQNVVLQLALEKGYVTLEEVILRTRWDEVRAKRILEFFENNKVARYVQSFEEGERWYFPGLSE